MTLPAGYFCARLFIARRGVLSLGLAQGFLGYLLYMTAPDWISVHMLAGPRYWVQPLTSEQEFCRHHHTPWRTKLAADHSKGALRNRAVGLTRVHVVEQVLSFKAKLERSPLTGDGDVFQD